MELAERGGGGGMGPGSRTQTGLRRRNGPWLLSFALLLIACSGGEAPGTAGGAEEASGNVAELASVGDPGSRSDSVVATDEDWRIVRRKVAWGRSRGLDTVSVGQAVARLGVTFVGTPYVPRTLEVEGPERLVVNLRALDCVTFVETVLALVHVIQEGPAGDRSVGAEAGTETGSADEELRRAYRRALTRIRYRDGILDGYPSRLHYFSEWIGNAEEKGLVRAVTDELGGVEDAEPVDFMTRHPDAYRQLADPAVRAAVGRTEEALSRTPRVYLPEERIADRADGIREGDIIAATSTVPGLDVAHTGIALRRDGRLHLLHAPLVGDSVQISERTLAQRIEEIESQDGILVARPVEPGGR